MQMPNDGIAHVREIPFNNKKTSTEEQHTMSEETERYILEHRNDDVRQLALKRQNNSSIDMAYALQQTHVQQVRKCHREKGIKINPQLYIHV